MPWGQLRNESCFVFLSPAWKSKHLFVDMILLIIDVKIEFASKLKYFPLVSNDHVNNHVNTNCRKSDQSHPRVDFMPIGQLW